MILNDEIERLEQIDKYKIAMDKAKKEKLVSTKNQVRIMNDTVLRDRVTAFLDEHPEFCDDFSE